MDNKKYTKEIQSSESDKDKQAKDYKFLVQKLKSIKESINLLEKKVSENKI